MSLSVARDELGRLYADNDPDEVTWSRDLLQLADGRYLLLVGRRIVLTLANETRSYRVTAVDDEVVHTVRERTPQ